MQVLIFLAFLVACPLLSTAIGSVSLYLALGNKSTVGSLAVYSFVLFIPPAFVALLCEIYFRHLRIWETSLVSAAAASSITLIYGYAGYPFLAREKLLLAFLFAGPLSILLSVFICSRACKHLLELYRIANNDPLPLDRKTDGATDQNNL